MLGRLRSKYTAFSHDLIMVPVAWFLAYWLRFNLQEIPQPYLNSALVLFPLVAVIQAVVFWRFGLYRGVWRFASMPDLVRITKAVVVGLLATTLIVFLFTRLHNVPRSVFPIYGILLLGLLSGPRFLYRWFTDRQMYFTDGKRLLIVGAGSAGDLLVRDLMRDNMRDFLPIGFVDDDEKKIGREIHGIRVLGSCDDIPAITRKHDIEQIVIAMPSINARAMQHIVQVCEKSKVSFRTLPKIQDLASGKLSVQSIREVSISDLLGREQVSLDWTSINEGFNGKTVLVSGGGGSIGAELCRQIAKLGPRLLIVLDQSEYNLYTIDLELKQALPNLKLESVLGDVCDAVLLEEVFSHHKPDIVFHAAAYKHVPLLENQYRAAALNNILGTNTLAACSDKHGCKVFVLVSSDKAVNPTNIMGATKRSAEIICQKINKQSPTKFITVRFGNVLDSAGSVIPLFRKQIKNNGPVTVTHPDITRYFMSIPEAAQLILQSGVIGDGGEIFVLDMGDPIKISYLAEQMILLSGKIPGEEIEITYTGLRPGEKLYEELFHEKEKLKDTVHPKIFLAKGRSIDEEKIDNDTERLVVACKENKKEEIRKIVSEFVPELSKAKISKKNENVYQINK